MPTISSGSARRIVRAGMAACWLATSLLADFASAQQPATPAPAPTVRLRGTIESASPTMLTLRTRDGQHMEVDVPADTVVTEVYPVPLSDVKPGSFVGAGAVAQADGTQRAIAVTPFPESARGSNEGHRPFDFVPQGTMTNATVAEAVAAADGSRLRLRYPEGEKVIVVPPGTPVVSFRPGDRSLLVPGASVALNAREVNGRPTALRISAGRNGFAVPY